MLLSEAACRLLEVLDPEGVLIGGLCGAIYGVERYTRDVDIAISLDPKTIISRLHDKGIEAMVRYSNEPDDLSWVVHGHIEGIEFQVLPASETGISSGSFQIRAGLRVADIKSFITSKCIAAGQQDMHDVAALSLLNPDLLSFAKEKASQHGCLTKLESWLDDRRLQQRYSATPDSL